MTNIEIIKRIRIAFEDLLNLKTFSRNLNCVMYFSEYFFRQSIYSVSVYLSVLDRPCKLLLIVFSFFERHPRAKSPPYSNASAPYYPAVLFIDFLGANDGYVPNHSLASGL